ncbi:ElyC/SanA/YdcF family protein [Lysobacter sp. LF1]|uniref:ElyC/SanA/YdcF family protein n=1 Tax=Lysobacter stagni TaxID=3045172 RepID=A0ABT6XJN8_9GAMM|nr:YdcF family protein [Lysobacter sp. LF1]MDI9240381.1 ElyC/SanA/YdcF family protein [Lysobacter sp. LF1]
MHHLLLSPMTWGLLWLAIVWLAWRRAGTAWRAVLATLGIAILVLCTPLGANALIRWVEGQVPAASRCSAGTGADADAPIVVLAGGLEDEPRATDDYIALTPASWRRLRGGVELWRRHPAPMVIAGGGPFVIKEATVLARLAQDWGVPAADLRTETASTNTWESAAALHDTLPARVRVVSSATHLPRALLAFRATGFQACGWASDSAYVAPGSVGYFLPQLSAMQKTRLALYETAGTLSYRWRARRTD